MICKMGIYLSIVDDRVIDARLSKTFTNITQMLNTTCQVAVKGRFVCIDVVCHNYNMNIGCKDTQKNGLEIIYATIKKRLGKFLYMWNILCTFAAVLVYRKRVK